MQYPAEGATTIRYGVRRAENAFCRNLQPVKNGAGLVSNWFSWENAD